MQAIPPRATLQDCPHMSIRRTCQPRWHVYCIASFSRKDANMSRSSLSQSAPLWEGAGGASTITNAPLSPSYREPCAEWYGSARAGAYRRQRT